MLVQKRPEKPSKNFIPNFFSQCLTVNCSLKWVFKLQNVWKNSFSRVKGRKNGIPMETSLSIFQQFGVEIPRGKFVDIASILKGKSTWKVGHPFNVEILMWIWLSKLTEYLCVFHVNISTPFRRQTEVTFVLAVSILLFLNILCFGNLF